MNNLTLKYIFQIHIPYVIDSLKPSFISTIIPANNEDCLAQKKKRNNNNVNNCSIKNHCTNVKKIKHNLIAIRNIF